MDWSRPGTCAPARVGEFGSSNSYTYVGTCAANVRAVHAVWQANVESVMTADSARYGEPCAATGYRARTSGPAAPYWARTCAAYCSAVRYGCDSATKRRASARVLPIRTGTLFQAPLPMARAGATGSSPSPEAGPEVGSVRAASTSAAPEAARRHCATPAGPSHPARVAKARASASARAASGVPSSVHGPLCSTARWNSPAADGAASSAQTEPLPADCPDTVTLAGFPPNAPMFCRVQRSASIWSISPNEPDRRPSWAASSDSPR